MKPAVRAQFEEGSAADATARGGTVQSSSAVSQQFPVREDSIAAVGEGVKRGFITAGIDLEKPSTALPTPRSATLDRAIAPILGSTVQISILVPHQRPARARAIGSV